MPLGPSKSGSRAASDGKAAMSRFVRAAESRYSMVIGVLCAIPLRSIVVSQWNFTGKPAGSL